MIVNRSSLRSLTGVLTGCALFGFASITAPPLPTSPVAVAPIVIYPFVVLGEQGTAIARVITSAAQCPEIRLDNQRKAMNLRAAAATVPLRSTRSDPADSKPSAFPVLTCEIPIPPRTQSASINGQPLAVPHAIIRRIVVIGDTGCRLKKSDQAYQACHDAAQYPFATIAGLAASWKPDLVIHVGDYLYRENPCPPHNAGCAGSPWGYGWDAWQADFFHPAAPLLKTAPWIMVRGNHELCSRAGQGWWRFIDPRALLAGRDCNNAQDDSNGDYSDAYAVPIGGDAQIIVLDTANTVNKVIAANDYRDIKYRALYRQIDALSQQASDNIVANHQPILGFAARQNAAGDILLSPGNRGLQSVFASINPDLLPPRIDVLLSGHIHVWEQISFSSPHPTQFIAGFSGTAEDIVPLPVNLPADASPAIGAVVAQFSSWVNGFGYMTMERSSSQHWEVEIRDAKGGLVNTCHIDGRKSICAIAQVQTSNN